MSHTVEQQTPFPIFPTLWEPSPRQKKAINMLKKGWLRRIALKEWNRISPDEIGQAKHTNSRWKKNRNSCEIANTFSTDGSGGRHTTNEHLRVVAHPVLAGTTWKSE